MRTVSLKKRILVPLVTAGIAVAIIGYYFLNNIEHKQKLDTVYHEVESMQSHLKSALLYKAEAMAGNLEFIQQNRELIKALKSKDRQRLIELGSSLYERLNRQYNITHFYFHDVQRINIVRIHKPEKFGDTINRFTALSAEKSGALFSGIELGPLGTFTLRSVLPVFEQGKLIGYMELGQEIDGILEETHQAFDVVLYMLIDKKYLDRAKWEEGMRMLSRPFDWEKLDDTVLVSQSQDDVPLDSLAGIKLEAKTHGAQVIEDVVFNSHDFWAGVIPITDAGNREVAHLVFLHDMTDLQAQSRNEMIWFLLLATLISWSIFIFFYRVLGSTEQELTDARKMLLAESEARTREVEQSLNIQRVLDEMLNISLPRLTMKEVILKSLDAVLSIPMFKLQNKGSVFLTVEGEQMLEMVAQRNLPDALLKSCALLPFGRCLCGKAAETREVVFINHLNEQHEITYNGIQPHGHYCIPIISGGQLLGVLNAYVEADHVREETEEGFLKNVADTLAVVIERKLAEEKLEKMAHNDNLTGLPNRTLFADRLSQALALAQRQKQEFAVMFLDLDHFKEINDTLGHDMGDVLLRQAANRLMSCVRKTDTVARMGGDEFTVILTETKVPGSVELVANNVLKSLLDPFELDGTSCNVGCSIGIAMYPQHGLDSETLLKHADTAMYYAKRKRNSYCFFSDTLI